MALFEEWTGKKPITARELVDYIVKNDLLDYEVKVEDPSLFMPLTSIGDAEVSHSNKVIVFGIKNIERD